MAAVRVEGWANTSAECGMMNDEYGDGIARLATVSAEGWAGKGKLKYTYFHEQEIIQTNNMNFADV